MNLIDVKRRGKKCHESESFDDATGKKELFPVATLRTTCTVANRIKSNRKSTDTGSIRSRITVNYLLPLSFIRGPRQMIKDASMERRETLDSQQIDIVPTNG